MNTKLFHTYGVARRTVVQSRLKGKTRMSLRILRRPCVTFVIATVYAQSGQMLYALTRMTLRKKTL
ncbi:hypothetical protein SNK04_14544 [Fusarium graminearum]